MAYIEKRKNKKGEVTAYRIRVYSGYDVHGKQIVQFKTWMPPEGMTANQIKKELQRQAVLFEEECANGQVTANIKFQKLAEQWFEEYAEFNHRSTTLEREKKIVYFTPRNAPIRNKENGNPKRGTHQSAARNALPDEVMSE